MSTVLLVDDQQLIRTGFRLILERAEVQVVGEAANGAEAIELTRNLRPDVVLMDIRMPVLDGIEATRQILAGPEPLPRVLTLTTFDTDEFVYGAILAGASGFALKDCSPEALVAAVRTVAAGETMLAPPLIRRLLERFVHRPPTDARVTALAGLTEREREVAQLVGRGLSNLEVAGALFLSEATVKTYVSRLLTKLGLRDRVQIAVFAYETGLIQPGSPP
ncbi:MAG: response regulator transcription factor [Humibacillus sp.]|nr:response regulator transcription factor [Humibacillus sp.]MDN5775499.1 response regulator transcription factor [Humibacillus sp.]